MTSARCEVCDQECTGRASVFMAGMMWIACPDCRRGFERADEIRAMRPRLSALATNLAAAAGLCRAFKLGWVYGETTPLMRDDEWEPGCGAPA